MLAVQRFTATGAVDAAFRLYRERFAALFLFSLVVAIPNTILGISQLLLQQHFFKKLFTSGSSMPADDIAVLMLAFLGYFMVVWIVAMMTNAFGMAGASRIASQAALGLETSLGDAVRTAFRVFWPLFGATLIAGIAATIAFFFFVIPSFIIFLGFAFVAPVIVIERVGAVDSLGRSWQLTNGRKLKLLGVFLLFIVILMAGYGGTFLVIALTGLMDGSVVQQVAQQLGTQAVAVVAVPVWNVAVVLLYYDARVEHDAFDVQTLVQMSDLEAART